MSLDVYLTLSSPVETATKSRIFVRRGGATVEISRDEWDEQYPGREPHQMLDDDWGRYAFEANITHNMGAMAGEVDLYDPLWRPDENGITHAAQMIPLLRDGLARLVAEHDRLQEFNPSNGWGSYELLVQFTRNYLAACERWPEAEVQASR